MWERKTVVDLDVQLGGPMYYRNRNFRKGTINESWESFRVGDGYLAIENYMAKNAVLVLMVVLEEVPTIT